MHWVGGMITLAMLLLFMITDFSPTITFSACLWEFSRQEHWSRLPFPIPGDTGIEPTSSVSASGFFTTVPPGKPYFLVLSHFSHVQLFATLWTIACQVSLSMGFCRQEYWSWLPCPPPRDLPKLGDPCLWYLLH